MENRIQNVLTIFEREAKKAGFLTHRQDRELYILDFAEPRRFAFYPDRYSLVRWHPLPNHFTCDGILLDLAARATFKELDSVDLD